MKLYNTLSRQLEDLGPTRPIKLYTCGPTVYDYAHIGNLRNLIFNDSLKRALTAAGYQVNHVMNVTDVGHLTSDADEGGDKLEAGAKREGKTVWDVADFYLQEFHANAAALNIIPPDKEARATNFIDQQIALVGSLFDNGFAYKTKQAIYFDVTKLSNYGKLSGQKLADKVTGARETVVTDAHKHHPQDFALWFFTVGHFADHTMRWDSPWGEGFPGWHLECSAIAQTLLGNPLDVHTGGVDHIGTHHTNEIAQTEAATGKPLAKTWSHNEFLLADGQKMSKSLGNYYTLKDLTARGYHPLSFRLLMLQSHYRSQVNFTFESLEAAQHFLLSLYSWAELTHQPAWPLLAVNALEPVEEALGNDLGTPEALARLTRLMTERPSSQQLHQLDQLFGLNLSQLTDISKEQKELIAMREDNRKNHDFAGADKLRTELEKQGIVVEDTPLGPRWRRAAL